MIDDSDNYGEGGNKMKYIALLRGINVGGNNKVPMSDLKNCFESAGFLNTKTYINSGNVIFESEYTNINELIEICENIIEKKFGFFISVTVIDVNSLKEVLEQVPTWWGDDPDSKHNALFVIPPATDEEILTAVGTIKPEYENVYAYHGIIFWSATIKTVSRTRWAKIVGTKAYQNVTIRNANTTRKLLELALS